MDDIYKQAIQRETRNDHKHKASSPSEIREIEIVLISYIPDCKKI